VTINPYAPPARSTEPAGGAAVPRSFARRLSLVLAAGGFLTFWGGGALLAYRAADDGVTTAAGILFAVIIVAAVSAHLVGVAIVFAAPRGRRLLPALLNGVSLAIMTAATVFAYRAGPG
jgi:hypothetical protein